MKITLTLDEARELAGAVTGPLRELLLAAILENTEEYYRAECIWCHRLVYASQGYAIWTSEYGRDVCKHRELDSDGEYQAHQVRSYDILEREKPQVQPSVMVELEGRGRMQPGRVRLDLTDDGDRPVLLWQHQMPLSPGATWHEWFTPDYEITVSGVRVGLGP